MVQAVLLHPILDIRHLHPDQHAGSSAARYTPRRMPNRRARSARSPPAMRARATREVKDSALAGAGLASSGVTKPSILWLTLTVGDLASVSTSPTSSGAGRGESLERLKRHVIGAEPSHRPQQLPCGTPPTPARHTQGAIMHQDGQVPEVRPPRCLPDPGATSTASTPCGWPARSRARVREP